MGCLTSMLNDPTLFHDNKSHMEKCLETLEPKEYFRFKVMLTGFQDEKVQKRVLELQEHEDPAL